MIYLFNKKNLIRIILIKQKAPVQSCVIDPKKSIKYLLYEIDNSKKKKNCIFLKGILFKFSFFWNCCIFNTLAVR